MRSATKARIFSQYSDQQIQNAIDRAKRETKAMELILAGATLKDVAAALEIDLHVADKALRSRILHANTEKPVPDHVGKHQAPIWVPYPENLLCAILYRKEISVYQDLPVDWEEALEYLLSTLSEKEQAILNAYYREDKTLDELSKEYGISRARVGQVRDHAIDRLRHPSRIRYLKNGFAVERARDEAEKRLKTNTQEELLEDIKKQFGDQALERYLQDYKQKVIMEYASQQAPIRPNDSIRVLDLSTRADNLLHRHGIHTVGQLMKCSIKELSLIQGMGQGTVTEVVKTMKLNGFSLPPTH